MIRPPAVAGQFYPGNREEIAEQLDQFIPVIETKRRVKALVVPHAGWMYSGATAGIAYSQIEVPNQVILVGPNHRNTGSPYAVFDAGSWRTPAGNVPIAETLAKNLLGRCGLLAGDSRAHAVEHSLEVQVPMLLRANPKVQIVPVLIGGGWPEAGGVQELRMIGEALAGVIAECGEPVLLVASTDLNHYEDEATSRRKDKLALEAVVALDEDGLMRRVREAEISMCGVAATYAVVVAAKRLGARRAELLDYRTSGAVSGDFQRVVGYGAVAIE